MSQKPSDNTSTDTQIIPTIKDPQIDSSYINQFAKFILPYIQQDYEREPFKKNGSVKFNFLFSSPYRENGAHPLQMCSVF